MTPTAHLYWDINPELFSLGPLTVRWYGLFFVITFFFGFLIVQWIFQKENRPEHDLNALVNTMVAGTVVGARLGHCLFYDPSYYLGHPLEILKVWRGGLSSHGGAIGIFVALYLYTRSRPDQPYLWILDRIAIPTALGGFFIRLGNFFNSEIIGTPTDLPWAFIFARVDVLPRHPTQLYESIAYGLIFILLLAVYRKRYARTPQGLVLGLFLVTVFTFRFFIEYVKVRQAAYGYELPLSVGQWLSIPMVAIGAVLLIRTLNRKQVR